MKLTPTMEVGDEVVWPLGTRYWSQTNPKRHSYYFNCVRYTKLRDALIAAEGVTL